MTKTELIKDPQVYFNYLKFDDINVFYFRFVSDEVIEVHCLLFQRPHFFGNLYV